MLIRSGALDIIVIDSVAALVPKAEIEGEMGDSHVGLQARLMSQALRKITGALSASGTTAIFINQLREKIGVFFGSPETTTGGKALKFYASVRLDIRRIETLKEGTDAVGNRTRVKVVKNKMAPPFKQAEFDILYGVGISREGGLIDMGVEHGFVRKSGSWFTYGGDQLGQGKENARSFLRDNPDLANELEKKIKEKLGVGAKVDAPADPAAGVTVATDAAPAAAKAPAAAARGRSRRSDRRAGRERGRRASRPARGGRRAPHGPQGRAAPAPSLHELVERGEISDADLAERARETVLRILTAAPKSRAELTQSLARKGYPSTSCSRSSTVSRRSGSSTTRSTRR